MATFPEDPITRYQQGELVTLFVEFTNAAGAPLDPVTLNLLIEEGDGNVLTIPKASLSNPSIGRWEYAFVTPKDGDKAAKPWTYRFEGSDVLLTGVNQVKEERFEVEPNPFYPPSA